MLTTCVGYSETNDADELAVELLRDVDSALGRGRGRAALLWVNHDVALPRLLSRIFAAHPGLPLVGCTTVAPMCSEREYVEGGNMLLAFDSDVVEFGAGLGRGLGKDVRGAAAAAIADARAGTSLPPALCIVVSSVEGFDPVELTDALAAELGPDCVLFGGGAHPEVAESLPWSGSAVACGTRVFDDGVAVLLLCGPLHVSVGLGHGWKPYGKPSVVTRAEGNVVHEIDRAPATDYFRRFVGAEQGPPLAIPLAWQDDATETLVLRTVMAHDEATGAVTLFGSVSEGATVRLAMASTDEILGGARAATHRALSSFPESGTLEAALVVSCTVRNILLGTRADAEMTEIVRALDRNVPINGFYSFGEIAPVAREAIPRFHNDTLAIVLLGT